METTGELNALLPSQHALGPSLLAFRYHRGELLFRARRPAEAPAPRPAVLVLDVSPAAFGPVEGLTRLGAYVLARWLTGEGVPVVLVTNEGERGGAPAVRALLRAEDLFEIWSRRSIAGPPARRTLAVASAIRAGLRSDSAEPVSVLFAHTWFGEGDEPGPTEGLRALFVRSLDAAHTPNPPLASSCERWEHLGSDDVDLLPDALAALVSE